MLKIRLNLYTFISGLVLTFTAVSMGSSYAAPGDPAWPIINNYVKEDLEPYHIGNDVRNVWFSTPTGLNCSIWGDNSFGCTGKIPGAPAANQVGFFTGLHDSAPHLDATGQPRFINPTHAAQRLLPAGSYLTNGDVTCAVTPHNELYCSNGNSRILLGAQKSWLY